MTDRPINGQPDALSRLGLVVHPVRNIEAPLRAVRDWASERGADLAQIPFAGEQPSLFEERPVEQCDLVVAIGGDGTTLAAIRSAAAAGRPVLGVACGSLGALTSVPAGSVAEALDRVAGGRWTRRAIPALRGVPEEGEPILAFNDIAVVRDGDGQVRVSVSVDGVLFARLAGDGCIVSTAAGSSAYTLAAGGPLLDVGLDAFVLTPLPTHGGSAPPLVVRADAELDLRIAVGHGGGRLEVDGRATARVPERLAVRLVEEAATVVAFADQESHLTGLRRRGIIADSPRIIADEERGESRGVQD